jgi:phospholipid transport system substrate-binding protein
MVRNPVSRKEDAMQHTYLSASQKQYAAIVFAIAWLVQPSIAAAGAPLDALQATSQKVHTVLNDMELKKPERAVERRNQLVSIIGERFSCEEMSKRSLGEEWPKLTDAEQEEFIRLFRTLLAKSYAGKIEGYAGAPVHYLAERLASGYAVVRAQVLTSKNEFLLDFRMVEKAGDWLVYDVVVDGISLMNSYRGQFARVLTFASTEGLLERMREKADLPVQARAD